MMPSGFVISHSGRLSCQTALALILLPALQAAGQAQDRARVVIIALDESGSMLQSDPQRIRFEATAMLAGISSPRDQFGLLAFGDDARWVMTPVPNQPGTLGRVQKALTSMPLRDQRTDFAAPLRLAQEYLTQQPAEFFKTYEVSLILLTDGRPDLRHGKASSTYELASSRLASLIRETANRNTMIPRTTQVFL